MTEPTDAELRALLPTKLLERDMPPKVQVRLTQKDALSFARAVLAKRGTPAGEGEVVALSEDQIIDLFNDACRETFNGPERFRYFARAIEAEVRKQDEALIRKMLDYLEEMQDEGPTGEGWKSDELMSVISAATARLEKEGSQGVNSHQAHNDDQNLRERIKQLTGT